MAKIKFTGSFERTLFWNHLDIASRSKHIRHTVFSDNKCFYENCPCKEISELRDRFDAALDKVIKQYIGPEIK